MSSVSNTLNTDTSHRVVLPFYVYAALSFLAACILLVCSVHSFTGHYFQPGILAVTHMMALGWGTMIILGASHQLIPVLSESRLFSVTLAWCSFVPAAVGIPLLVYSFYTFHMGWTAQWGGAAIVLSVATYVVNLWVTVTKGKRDNVHAIFVLTAAVWLFLTVAAGLTLVYNFTNPFLPMGSLAFLPLHAHLGLVGWFLLLVIGVGSRLIPLFLLSKYTNDRLLWTIYFLVNGGLLVFIGVFFISASVVVYILPAGTVFAGVFLFGYYCRNCYRERLRKKVEDTIKFSVLSVGLMVFPLLPVTVVLLLRHDGRDYRLVLVYGFLIFFGWITAMIQGMTFKTLPFIVWNRLYRSRTGLANTPNPKDLVAVRMLRPMMIVWAAGFLVFTGGIWARSVSLLQVGAVLLLGTAFLYCGHVFHLVTHKTKPV